MSNDNHRKISDAISADRDNPAESHIDPRMLEMLVCPQTRGPLIYDRVKGELLSKNAGLAYPIRDSIPIMLPDEARSLTDDEINRL